VDFGKSNPGESDLYNKLGGIHRLHRYSKMASANHAAGVIANWAIARICPPPGGTISDQSLQVVHCTIWYLAGMKVKDGPKDRAPEKQAKMAAAVKEFSKGLPGMFQEKGIDVPEVFKSMCLSSDISLQKPLTVNASTSTAWDKFSDFETELNNVVLPVWKRILPGGKIPSGTQLVEIIEEMNTALFQVSESK